MPALFDLLTEEEHPSVRVVLGNFVFVNIHPYMDGNGRIGRFLMNLMLAARGYPWTVVPLADRNSYMAALGYRTGRNFDAELQGQLIGDACLAQRGLSRTISAIR
jgi:Fic family protein